MAKTHQRWKVVLFLIVMFFSISLFLAGEYVPTSLAAFLPGEMALVLSGTALGAVALLWISFSIRCPVCRKNVGGYAVSHFDAMNWLTTFLKMEKCPRCGN
jgi:hypothetical protein